MLGVGRWALMANDPHPRVSNPPPKPLLIWDGECHFCRRWIERWREITRGKIEFATYQEPAHELPEISREQFHHAIAFIDKEGKVFFAAKAVYRSLRCRFSRKWLSWSYDRVPAFAPVSELAYKFIARHRRLGSAITRLLWGEDVRPPNFFWARKWFLRSLGLVYLIAFVSLWVQIDGLIGSNGILPVHRFLSAAQEQLGDRALSILPTLCWFSSSDAFLHFLCAGGVVLSILFIAGIAPAICLIALFVFYLSLTVAGQTFLSFQWDILLLETGFLSIFLAPWQLRRGRDSSVSRAGLFLLKFLLFKLMLMSGVVKLTSGDDCWWNLTALHYHYETQPLPTPLAWWANQFAPWFQAFSTVVLFAIEIGAPFLLFGPRRMRLIGVLGLLTLQALIAATGNYCFFNLLTAALCLLAIDDAVWPRIGRKASPASEVRGAAWPSWLLIPLTVVVLGFSGPLIWNSFFEAEWPPFFSVPYSYLE